MNNAENPNYINILLDTVTIQDLFMCNNFDLKPYGIDAFCSTIKPYRVAIFWNTKQNKERKAIQIEIPTYEKIYPEKLEATSFGLFMVHEYTKREAYNTIEIDWVAFKSKFIDACMELHRHCV